MELEELKPDGLEGDIPLEEIGTKTAEPPRRGRKRAKKPRTKRRMWLLAVAAALCVVILVVALNWTAIQVRISPLWALKSGMDRLSDLPQPVSVGFLGTVELGEVKLGAVDLGQQALDCSGTMDIQTGEDGMRLALKDCTLGKDAFSTSFSLYVSPAEVAASVPLLAHGDERWYGVSLETPLLQQTVAAGVDVKNNVLLGAAELLGAQAVADSLKTSLSEVTKPGLGEEETEGLVTFLKAAKSESQKTGEGYQLRFTQTEDDRCRQLAQAVGLDEDLLCAPVTLDFTLTGGGTLRGVGATSGNLCFSLDLGADPAEDPAPRLEADWTDEDGNPCALTLALTIDAADEVTAPAYTNAFTLLNRSKEDDVQ